VGARKASFALLISRFYVLTTKLIRQTSLRKQFNRTTTYQIAKELSNPALYAVQKFI